MNIYYDFDHLPINNLNQIIIKFIAIHQNLIVLIFSLNNFEINLLVQVMSFLKILV